MFAAPITAPIWPARASSFSPPVVSWPSLPSMTLGTATAAAVAGWEGRGAERGRGSHLPSPSSSSTTTTTTHDEPDSNLLVQLTDLHNQQPPDHIARLVDEHGAPLLARYDTHSATYQLYRGSHDDALEDAMVQSVTEPSKEDSTELGEVPQEVEKGTVPKYPAIKSYYRVY